MIFPKEITNGIPVETEIAILKERQKSTDAISFVKGNNTSKDLLEVMGKRFRVESILR